MKLIKIVFFNLFLFLFFNNFAFSSHASGGYISYKPTGTPNEYEITLTVYRDCSGIELGNTRTIEIVNSCNSSSTTTIVLPLESLTEISQFCDQDLTNTQCNQGNFPGFEKNIYKDTILLNGLCNDWILSCEVHLRNGALNITGGSMYIETRLNNLDYPMNSSPTRNSNFPIPVISINQHNSLSLYFNDPDHDSLKFELVSAFLAPNQPVNYVPPYSAFAPIAGLTIDPNTGELNFSASFFGNYVISVLISEYTDSGILKGSTKFDFLINLEFIDSDLPQMDTIQNFNNFGTGATVNANIINVNSGDQFCFDVSVTDAGISDSIFLSSDINNFYPNATFIQTGYNPAVAEVCWTASSTSQRAIFSIQAQGNFACPILNIVSKAYLIEIDKKIEFTQSPLYICDSSITYDLIASDSGLYHWYDLNGDLLDIGTDISCNPCMSAKLYFDNDTNIIARYNNQTLCSDTLEIKANFIPDNLFTQDTLSYCIADTLTLYSPKTELINIWNNLLIQDSLILNFSNDSLLFLEVNYDWHCPVLDSLFLNPISGSDLLIDTLVQCNGSPNIIIASNSSLWYDGLGSLLDIGTDVDCNPCNNPKFLFTNDTVVYKPTNQYCSTLDTLYIKPNEILSNYFADTIFFCDEDIIELINPFANYNAVWHTGETNDTIQIQTDSIQYGSLSIYIDTLICDTELFLLFSQQTNASIIYNSINLTTEQFISYQWLFNNTSIIGAINQSHLPLNNGDYQIYVIDSLGCTDTSDVFVITGLSIDENDISSSIYRSNNQIIVNDPPINSTIELYGISGKLIERRIVSGGNTIINLPKTKQIYIVKLIDENGETIAIGKL